MTSSDKISNTDLATILSGITDWHQAVDALVAHWALEGECYSSGEVAAALREHSPNLRFSVPNVGAYLRDLFFAETLPGYDDGMGDTEQPLQLLRPTEGLYPSRTPAGVEVYVYGPDQDTCMDHAFEVFIPIPGGQESQADAPVEALGQTAQAAADSSGNTPTAVAILGAKIASADIRCGVQPDKRLTVPRRAFEYAVSLGGHPMRGGDPVWAVQKDGIVTVYTSDPADLTQRQYALTTDRGRVLIPSDDLSAPFVAGETYKVAVSAGQLVIDTTAPVNG